MATRTKSGIKDERLRHFQRLTRGLKAPEVASKVAKVFDMDEDAVRKFTHKVGSYRRHSNPCCPSVEACLMIERAFKLERGTIYREVTVSERPTVSKLEKKHGAIPRLFQEGGGGGDGDDGNGNHNPPPGNADAKAILASVNTGAFALQILQREAQGGEPDPKDVRRLDYQLRSKKRADSGPLDPQLAARIVDAAGGEASSPQPQSTKSTETAIIITGLGIHEKRDVRWDGSKGRFTCGEGIAIKRSGTSYFVQLDIKLPIPDEGINALLALAFPD